MQHDLGNVTKKPYLEQMIHLASLIHQVNVTYRDDPVAYADMDWCDATEAYEDGYIPDPSLGSMWYTFEAGDSTDLGPFWETLQKLEENPPMKAIRQLMAIDHMMDTIHYLEESDEFIKEKNSYLRGRFLYSVVMNTKNNLRREWNISPSWF